MLQGHARSGILTLHMDVYGSVQGLDVEFVALGRLRDELA